MPLRAAAVGQQPSKPGANLNMPRKATGPLMIHPQLIAGGARNCGACEHCDPHPIEPPPRLPFSYCRKRCTFELWETPRGEPYPNEYRCGHWEIRVPARPPGAT